MTLNPRQLIAQHAPELLALLFTLVAIAVALHLLRRPQRKPVSNGHARPRPLTGVVVAIFAATCFLVLMGTAYRLAFNRPSVELIPHRQLTNSHLAIVLIHGWHGADGTWDQFLPFLTADERFRSADIWVANYGVYGLLTTVTIESVAKALALAIQDKSQKRVVVIAHSLGGVIARSIVIGSERSLGNRIGAIVTFASPHNGAEWSRVAMELGFPKAIMGDLQTGSLFVTALNAVWSTRGRAVPDLCIASEADSFVTTASALATCSRTRILGEFDHFDIIRPGQQNDPRYRVAADFLEEVGMVAQ